MASAISLPGAYAAGPAGPVAQLAEDRIEALPAAPDDSLSGVEDWVSSWAEEATARLSSAADALITTSRGTVRAWLLRPSRPRPGSLRTRAAGDNGVTSTGQALNVAGEAKLRSDVSAYLTREVIQVVGG